MKNILGVVVALFVSMSVVFGQPENASVEVIDGKKYYVHIVEKGNTLYGIHRMYEASVESILEANKGLSDNLELGQKVYIPISVSDTAHYGKHTVKQGETLYGISKKYKCSVDDLKNLNNSLTDGISPGQVIMVPKSSGNGAAPSEVIQSDPVVRTEVVQKEEYNVIVTDSIVSHTVLAHETMYSIARRYMVSSDTIMAVNGMRNARIRKGDVLKIPIKKVNYTVTDKELSDLVKEDSTEFVDDASVFKESYNVALFLPLMLDRNDVEMNKPVRLNKVKEMYSTTKISFGFYQGFLLAADSLSKAGLNVNIYVYDTKKDTNEIGRIFKKPEFSAMDLVVGPLSRNTIKYTADKCHANKIRIVLPFKSDMDVLYHNPYVYKGVASNMTLLDGTVDYVLENHKYHNVILLKPTSASDLALYERVRDRFNKGIKNETGAYNLSIIESGLGSSGGRELNSLVKKDTVNLFIIPSTNLSYVSGAMNRLNKVMNMNPYAKNFKLIAFGLEEWNKFDELDVKYRNRMNQHYASYRYVDYNSEKGVEFVKAFRKAYSTDPNVYSSQGFDVGMYFLSALKLYGTNFDLAIDQHQMDLVQNSYRFKQIDKGSGRENQRVAIIKYNDFKLEQLK